MLQPIVCLAEKIKKGEIKGEGAEALLRKLNTYNKVFGNEEKAGRVVQAQMERKIISKARATEMAAKSIKSLEEELATREDKMGVSATKLFTTEFVGQRFKFHVESARDMPLSFLGELQAKHNIKLRDMTTVQKEEVLRGLFGGSVKDEVSADTVKALRKAIEFQRGQAIRSGAPLKPLEDGHLPITMLPGKFVNITKDEFISDMGKLNKDFIAEHIDFLDIFEGGFNEYLGWAYDIMKGGTYPAVAKLKEAGLTVRPNQIIESLLQNITTNNLDTYRYLAGKYGSGKANVAIDLIQNINANAKVIGRKNAFGDTTTYLTETKSMLKEKGTLNSHSLGYFNDYEDFVRGNLDDRDFLNRTWDINFFGKVVSIRPAAFLSAVQTLASIRTATGGPISALLVDPSSSAAAMQQLGFKNTNQALTALGGLFDFRKYGKKSKDELALIGFGNRALTDSLIETTRYLEGTSTGFGQYFVRKVSELSGVEALTAANRRRMNKMMGVEIANLGPMKWADLDPSLQRNLRIAGFTPDEWADLTSTKWTKVDGVAIASPYTLVKAGKNDLAQKFNAFMLLGEEKGVPTGSVARDVYKKKWLKGAGTLQAFAVESAFTYRGPVTSLWENHLRQALQGRNMDVFATFVTISTLLGTARYTVENALKGETTDFSDKKTYLEGFVKGGAVSFIGDVLPMAWNDWQTWEKTVTNQVSGVTFGTYADIGKALNKAATGVLSGNDTAVAYDLFKVADKYNPLSTMWFTRGMWEKYAASKIRFFLNAKKERKRRQWLRREMRKSKTERIF